jgi:hypothetical protein
MGELMLRRSLSAAFALVLVAVSSIAAEPTTLEPRDGVGRRSSVTRGTVFFVDLPDVVMLEDGTAIELTSGTLWSVADGPSALFPGDEILVVGTLRDVGGTATVSASAVRTVRRAGRRLSPGGVFCPQAKVVDPLTAASGIRSHTTEEETRLEGTVLSISSDGFALRTDDAQEYSIVVTADTELRDIGTLADLAVGDRVSVRGALDGTVLTATRVELLDGSGGSGGGGDGGGGDDDGGDAGDDVLTFKTVGLVTEIRPPDRFAMDDDRVYRVDADTRYDEAVISYSGLSVGQYLEVEASYLGGGDYLALKVKFEGDDDDGDRYRSVEGTVAAVDGAGLTLTDGVGVLFTSATTFNGDADRPEMIRPGWRVEAVALQNVAGDLLARTVRAEDDAPPTTEGEEFEPHEALAILGAGVDAEAVADRHDADVSGQVGSLAVLLRWDDEVDDERLARLHGDPEVRAVEPNYRFRDPESVRRRFPVIDRAPTRERYSQQRAAKLVGLESAQMVSAGRGTVVAVLDTGVEPCHPLLRGHLAAGGLDLIDGDLEPWENRDGVDQDLDGDLDEAAGHGTFVASIVALVAPRARILPYRVLDDDGGGTAYHVALALVDAIDREVDVINLSLSYRRRSTVVDLLLEEAADRGIVVVAAAGNDGSGSLPFPAVDSHVLAVGALNADATRLAEFSNRGAGDLVAAPGREVYGALDGGAYGHSTGTSMAAPFAAGGAAMVKSLDPEVSAALVRSLLATSGFELVNDPGPTLGLDLGHAVATIAP